MNFYDETNEALEYRYKIRERAIKCADFIKSNYLYRYDSIDEYELGYYLNAVANELRKEITKEK